MFDTLCFPLIPKNLRDKFEPTSNYCCFIGYSPNHKTYKCLKLKDSTIIFSRHFQFYENICPLIDYKIKDNKDIKFQIPHLPISITRQASETNDKSNKEINTPTTELSNGSSHNTNQTNTDQIISNSEQGTSNILANDSENTLSEEISDDRNTYPSSIQNREDMEIISSELLCSNVNNISYIHLYSNKKSMPKTEILQ